MVISGRWAVAPPSIPTLSLWGAVNQKKLKESIHEKDWCKLIIISLVLLGLSAQVKMGK